MKRKTLLAMAVALLCSVGSWAYQTPEANGIYYLYNTACTDGTPGFMSSGNGYGFQVVIDNFGFPVKLVSTGTANTYKFQFIHHNGWLSDDGFMYSDGDETNRARTITVQDQGDGKYKLLNTNNSKEIEDWYGNVVGDGTGSRHNYLWQFLSKAERDAMVAGYTTSVKLAAATSMGMPASIDTESEFDDYLSTNYIGIDQSAKITNGTFTTAHVTTDWSTTANSNRTFNIGWGNKDPKDTPEVYEGAGYLTHTTITVDKVGLYKVSVNATYRCGNAENNNRVGDLGYDGSVAYLKANNSFTKVPDWYSGKINGNGPDSPSEANSVYFSAGKYLTEVYVYIGEEKKLDIELHSHAFTWGGWLMFNNFKLTYYSDEVSDDDATAILTAATTLEAQEMDADLLSALSSTKTTFDGARTIANYNALQTAIDAAQASADAYALFAPERTKALALGMTSEQIAAVAPNVNALKVAEYNYVTTNYEYGVALGEWTSTGTNTSAATFNNEHWSGTTHDYKNQKDSWGDPKEGYAAGSWSIDFSQDVSLPAGDYVFKVAGRQASGDKVTTSLIVKNGEDVLGTVNDFPRSNNSRGINKSGETAFDGDASEFANNGNGFGWEWRYVKFTLDEPATVNIAVKSVATDYNQWVSFGDYTLQTNDEDNVALMEALVALNDAKTAATLTKITGNIGTGVFQYNENTNNSLWTAYETAKSNADAYEFTSSSTASEVNTLATALSTAISNYQNQQLNAPAADNHYYVKVATSGHGMEGNAIVLDRVAEYPVYSGKYISNNTGFALTASAKPAEYLAQVVTFTHVSGNTYNISMQRTEGTVYWTYGSLNDSKVNWKESQIQATTESSKKGEFKIVATTTANVFNIVNTTATGGTIACQAEGPLYTEAGNADFTLAEATQASVPVTLSSGKYGTRIFPFTPSAIDGITYYSCDAVDGSNLTLSPVAEPAANTPYIIYASKDVNETLEGWGTAATTSYKVGLLTGIYDSPTIAASANNYVLQTLNGVQAFYLVKENFTNTQPYRAYITNAPTEVKALNFVFDELPTAINAVEAAENEKAEIYNLAGQRLNKAQKGVNIINGKKVLVK